jgi:hypothetical protein
LTLLSQRLLIDGNGWGDGTISEPRYPHDLIELTFPGHKRISEKAIELYERGHSIAETASMVGMAATSLFDAFKEQRIPTRPAWKTKNKNPPYGYLVTGSEAADGSQCNT